MQGGRGVAWVIAGTQCSVQKCFGMRLWQMFPKGVLAGYVYASPDEGVSSPGCPVSPRYAVSQQAQPHLPAGTLHQAGVEGGEYLQG